MTLAGRAGMDEADFRRSMMLELPPPGLGDCLAALWWAGRHDWDRAHAIVQCLDGRDPAWVHAHLHRMEGDLDNARYWYRQAGRAMPANPPQEEWMEIVRSLLQRGPKKPED